MRSRDTFVAFSKLTLLDYRLMGPSGSGKSSVGVLNVFTDSNNDVKLLVHQQTDGTIS